MKSKAFTLTLTFVALDGAFIDAVSQEFQGVPRVQGMKNNIQAFAQQKDVAFVSPANSFLYQDGGIDLIYSRELWPGIESKCKTRMKLLEHKDFIDRPFLPIGSAIIMQADVEKAQWLVCALTMLLPQPIPQTCNAYWAMLAIFHVVDKLNCASGRTLHNKP